MSVTQQDRATGQRFPQEVADFCSRQGCVAELGLVVELVAQAFPEAKGVTVGLEHDPESEQRWVVVDARVSGPAKDVLARHRACVRRVLELLPWPLTSLIRTTYTLV
jgi:hypothetical protein